MRKFGLGLIGAAALGVVLVSSQAYALPTCAGGTIALPPVAGR